MVRPKFFIACALAGVVLTVPVAATVLLPADFATVVNGSQVIVHGRVAAVRSAMTADRRSIYSLVTVTVVEAMKGDPGSTVTFRVPNGQVGRYRRVLVGAPEFREGDEAVVFLSGRAPAMPVLFGLSQGVYRVARGADGRPLVTRPPVTGRSGAGPVVRGDPRRAPLLLTEFAREVRATMEAAP